MVRRRVLLALTGAGVLAAAACGSSAKPPAAPGFTWLAFSSPAGWPRVSIPSGASMPYPRGWKLVHSDAGTATAVLRNASGRYLGFLNITPRQGGEQLATWASFRVNHNREEGDSDVRNLVSARGLAFRSGRGSCVEDTYTTKIHASFRELACLVAGSRATTVIVAAAPPKDWPRISGELERAVASFVT